PPLRRYVEEGAVALRCPPEFLGVPMLVIAGAAIGTSYVLEVKPGWRERPCLYAAIVAPPGKGKSPPLDAVARPVHARPAGLMEVWQDVMKLWEGLSSEVKPPRPILGRVVVNDTTTEALAPILKENPRGVVVIRDEFSALVHSMNQYKPHG